MKIEPYNPLCFIPAETNPEKEYFAVVSRITDFTDVTSNLLPAEEIKANRFHRDEDRKAYRVRHHLLNSWLSYYSKISVRELKFSTNTDKKPALNYPGFHFNISRSGDVSAFLFGPQEGGIDIEMIRNTDDFKEVAESHFHPIEKKAIDQNTDPDLFLKIWTRKEAYLKAIGTGLTDSLNSINCLHDFVVDKDSTYYFYTFNGGDFIMSIAIPERIKTTIKRFVY